MATRVAGGEADVGEGNRNLELPESVPLRRLRLDALPCLPALAPAVDETRGAQGAVEVGYEVRCARILGLHVVDEHELEAVVGKGIRVPRAGHHLPDEAVWRDYAPTGDIDLLAVLLKHEGRLGGEDVAPAVEAQADHPHRVPPLFLPDRAVHDGSRGAGHGHARLGHVVERSGGFEAACRYGGQAEPGRGCCRRNIHVTSPPVRRRLPASSAF